MIGRSDLIPVECDVCNGSRRNPSKRTRPCDECRGSGKIHKCPDCGGIWGRDCEEVCLDQTTCHMKEIKKS